MGQTHSISEKLLCRARCVLKSQGSCAYSVLFLQMACTPQGLRMTFEKLLWSYKRTCGAQHPLLPSCQSLTSSFLQNPSVCLGTRWLFRAYKGPQCLVNAGGTSLTIPGTRLLPEKQAPIPSGRNRHQTMVVSGGGCGFIDTTMKSIARYHLRSLGGETTSSHEIIIRCNDKTFSKIPLHMESEHCMQSNTILPFS